MSKKGVRVYSLDALKTKLKNETTPEKRQQLRLLLDEMAEVYPDESEIPNNPEEIFILPKQWKSGDIKKKIVMCIKGQSTSGKTFTALSSSHLTQKHILHDFSKSIKNKTISKQELQYFFDELDKYIPFTPVWVIGTEESTYECLTSDDNAEFFEHADVRYVEVLQKGSGLSFLDHMSTYKNFLIALYSLSGQKRGTIVIDSSSGVLSAQHEVVRRVIAKIPSLKKEQGIPTRQWFWRNVEREGMMFYGRITPVNFIFTIKQVMKSRENQPDFLATDWWERTDRHLSSIIIQNEQLGNTNKFRSTIEKCRPNSRFLNKSYQNMTLPVFMYNLIMAKNKKNIK